MKQRTRFVISVVILNLVLIGALSAFSMQFLVAARGRSFDFYPHWVGGRAVWSGETPYTSEITAENQRGIYGFTLPADSTADQHYFAYPAYTSIMLMPVILLPAETAIALWTALQLLSFLWVPIVMLVVLNWRPSPFVLAIIMIGLVFVFRHPMNVYLLGQFPGLMTLLMVTALLLLLKRRDLLAGVLLALATVPPTTSGPMVMIILSAYLFRGRWHGLAAFIVTLTIVTGISILLAGWWLPDWFAVVRAYADYAPPAWSLNILPFPLNGLYAGGWLVLLLWVVWRFVGQPDPPQQIDMFITAIVAMLALLPLTGNYYYVLLIPLLMATAVRALALPRALCIAVMAGLVLTVISPWLYVRYTEHMPEVEAVLFPLQAGGLWLVVNWRRWRNSVQQPNLLSPAPLITPDPGVIDP